MITNKHEFQMKIRDRLRKERDFSIVREIDICRNKQQFMAKKERKKSA